MKNEPPYDSPEYRYYELLSGVDHCLYHLQRVIADHDSCEGCEICRDAIAVEHILSTFEDFFQNNSPPASWQMFERETDPALWEKEEELLKQSRAAKKDEAAKNAATPAPVVVTELPPAKDKPYWLA